VLGGFFRDHPFGFGLEAPTREQKAARVDCWCEHPFSKLALVIVFASLSTSSPMYSAQAR
jgi:hypothetical protein